ncbi:TonB-dependent receptor [Pseudidiomarina sp. E22-M8]|uniref:TonB-dependent receptor n=1 Tax=Pseudidiomarina sp. E22-M8 TaxID=3424768 RepID=UPI00403C40C1
MLQYSPLALLLAQVLATPAWADEQEQTHQHEDTEVILINASPLARTELNSAQPISVLSGDELREKQAHTLGETLAKEPGINATHFARVASSPIIRGLDGPRVKITQNGLDTADVSRGSPDHAVTTETSVAQQVEILRGPATLLYGSGAIGGVVNVVDERIAQASVGGTRGFFGGNLASVDDLRDFSAGMSTDVGATVWHFDGFTRSSDDYQVPEFTNEDDERVSTIENSFVDATGGTIGTSYLFDKGYAGLSYSRLEQSYGIPGHHHDEHETELENDHGNEAEALPYADLEQDRVQLHAGFSNPFEGIEKLEIRYGYTDYQHQEMENSSPSTTFTNNQHELRITANHHLTGNWYGAIGYHGFSQQQQAFGEEAYTPPSETDRHGFFWLAETQAQELNWQTGIRYERVSIDAPTLALGTPSYEFEPFSASFGVSYQWQPGVRLNANFSHAQRAPSANELFANGEHLATQTYELGLGYALHEEAEHVYAVEANDRRPLLEKSNTLDLGAHIESGDNHLHINLFANRIDNYVYESFTPINSVDLVVADDHGHDDEVGHEPEAEAEHDHEEGLPVIQYTQRDVLLFGYEINGRWQLDKQWRLTAFSDYTRAYTTDNQENLPRLPAQRIGADVTYNQGNWETQLGYIWYSQQSRTAVYESATPSYGLLNAQFNWFPQAGTDYNLSLYLKAENLTDKLGYVHTSFLKDTAPVAGRNFSIGLRGEF